MRAGEHSGQTKFAFRPARIYGLPREKKKGIRKREKQKGQLKGEN